LELLPCGCISPTGDLGLAVPQEECDYLGRLAVGIGQIQEIVELQVDGQVGGHRRPIKTGDKSILSRLLLLFSKAVSGDSGHRLQKSLISPSTLTGQSSLVMSQNQHSLALGTRRAGVSSAIGGSLPIRGLRHVKRDTGHIP